MFSGIGSTIVQGMAFGTGSSIAHHAVNAVLGGGSKDNNSQSQQQAPQQQAAPQAAAPKAMPTVCQDDYSAFTQCMKLNPNNISNCDFYLQSLQACQSANDTA